MTSTTICEVRAAAANFGFDTFRSNEETGGEKLRQQRESARNFLQQRPKANRLVVFFISFIPMVRLCQCALQRRTGGQVRVLRCGEWWIGSCFGPSSVAGSHYLAHFTWDFCAIWVPLILLWLLGFIDFPLIVSDERLDLQL
nr:hypothetical protein Itr_chr13CG09200 [Ipomoea trifida]